MKALTDSQLAMFKELYLMGYSGSLIFEKLGQPYSKEKFHLANSRMRIYRVKLGLPMRGIGSKPRYSRYPQPTLARINRIQRRIKKLKVMIPCWQKKIHEWQVELENLEGKLKK